MSTATQILMRVMSTFGEMLQRLIFYPTLAYNVLMTKLGCRPWYNRIDETVLLGALPFRSMTKELLAENVRVVINMTEPFETKWWVNTAEEWDSYGIVLVNLSTRDMVEAPSQQNLVIGVQCILDQRRKGNSVYVHCKAGRTRSTTVVACYLMQRHNWSPEEAVEFIRRKRPHIILRNKQKFALHKYYLNRVIKTE